MKSKKLRSRTIQHIPNKSLQIRNQQASFFVVFKHSIPSPCSSTNNPTSHRPKIRIVLPKTYHAQAINTKLQLTRFSFFQITIRKWHCSNKLQQQRHNTCTEPSCSFQLDLPALPRPQSVILVTRLPHPLGQCCDKDYLQGMRTWILIQCPMLHTAKITETRKPKTLQRKKMKNMNYSNTCNSFLIQFW